MKTALPTARALGLQGAAPDPWITLYRSELTYFANSDVQRSGASAANRDLAASIAKWQGKYPKLVDWVESNIGETLSFYRLPRAHHKHLKSTNMLERLNEEIR